MFFGAWGTKNFDGSPPARLPCWTQWIKADEKRCAFFAQRITTGRPTPKCGVGLVVLNVSLVGRYIERKTKGNGVVSLECLVG